MLLILHGTFARALGLYLVAVGAWGILAWRRGAGVSPGFRGALAIAWVTGIIQGALGAALAVSAAPRDPLHILYGVAIAVALPAAFLYARDRTPARQSLVLGLVALFTSGLAIRGIMTG